MGRLVAFQGASGSGKSTLGKLCGLPFFTTYTTRDPREGEIDGIDYHFISREKMFGMIEKDELAEFVNYDGDCYGTTKAQIKALVEGDQNYYVILTVEGVEQYRELLGTNLYVIGLYMSFPNALERLRKRHGQDHVSIARRLDLYEKEIRDLSSVDIVVNTDGPLELSQQAVEAIIKLLQK